MKNGIFVIVLFIVSLAVFAAQRAYAQDYSYGQVAFLNGNEAREQDTEIGANELNYIHKGETLVNTLKKDDISKIKLTSGKDLTTRESDIFQINHFD